MPTPQGGAKTGVANSAAPVDNRNADGSTPAQDPKLTARERALASMDAKIWAQRDADHAEALAAGDPLAVALEKERLGLAEDDASFEAVTQIRPAVVAPRARPEVSGLDEEEDDTAPAPRTRKPTVLADGPGTVAEADRAATVDPLADFIVMKDGKPMVQLKVDGQVRLIPADQARAQLQKATAAELRLQQATQMRKQNEAQAASLTAREANVAAREAKIQLSTPVVAADDPGLHREAKDLVTSLLSDSPEVAATKLAGALARNRQAATPAVDVRSIVEQATVAAKQSIRAEEASKDVVKGFKSFETDYPEIAQDPNLFRYADSLSDVIATEHPDWAPSQIMAEAGKQTRDWVASLGGTIAAPVVKPPLAVPTTNSRQLAKQQLRPAPVVRAVSRSTAASPDNAPLAPADVLAEIRRSRGQAA